MSNFLKIALPVFLIGFAAGNAFWYLASPLWIDREVSEGLPAELMLDQVATGVFRDADQVHKGQGNVDVLQTGGGIGLVRFTEFTVTNGPDLEVWLVAASDPKTAEDVTSSEWVSLGTLKGNIGDQNYTVPDDVDLSSFGSVVIWCEQFGVLFAAAALSHES
jgi:hypothetical protein